MTISACCASGALMDLVTGISMAATTRLFWGIGVFMGVPLQNTAPWVRHSWFTTKLYDSMPVISVSMGWIK